jgi:hypothetical protein
MARLAVWRGGEADILRLLEAVQHNCACSGQRYDGERRSCCAAHQMLAFDQRALDGLLFARWLAAQLEGEEWDRSASIVPVTPMPSRPTPQPEQQRAAALVG